MTKYKELHKIKVAGHWYLVFMSGFDKRLKEEYFTVQAEDGSYIDVFESQVQEKEYQELIAEPGSLQEIMTQVSFDTEKLKLWKKVPKDEN